MRSSAAGFAGGTYVLEGEVNGDRAVAESDYRDNRLAGPSFVVLPPYGDIAAGSVTYDVLDAGGGEFRALPCLNESPPWIEALARIATGSA